MLNVLKEILRELKDINKKLDRLENKDKVIGTKVNRRPRMSIPRATLINGGSEYVR